MSDTRAPTTTGDTPAGAEARVPHRTRWTGWIAFAAFLMLMLGFFQGITGLAAIFNEDYYRVGPNGLVLEVDYTVWGLVHLALGVAVFLSGLGVLNGNVVARTVGVVLAGLSALANLAFVAAEPGWALTIVTVDVLVIYALIVHGHEMRDLL
jgi:hypothetical protein